MKWIKASERLPEKRHNYFVKMLTPKNSVMKQYVWNSTCVFDGEKFVDDINRGELLNGNTVVEWLDESGSDPEGKEAVELWLNQELKGLDKYLDDLVTNHLHKDAGNLWIAFSDKFQAFKKQLYKIWKEQAAK